MGQPFRLHPQLQQDCHTLGRCGSLHVLLHRNASLPWLIVVPATDASELFTMSAALRRESLTCCQRLSDWLLQREQITKINFAAIGNMVPQLHLHLVGRYPGDPCWPRPVWGNLNTDAVYDAVDIAKLREQLADRIDLRW